MDRGAKNEWQRRQRQRFHAERGYGMTAYYHTGRLRQAVLERDGYACVKCGMTDAQHKARWSRPITIDHIDKNRQHNALDNLQALCLVCHGRKDLIARLRAPKVPPHREKIMVERRSGWTYQRIADAHGVSVGAVWKWVQRWMAEEARP